MKNLRFLVVLAALPFSALAQTAGGFSAGPSDNAPSSTPADYETHVVSFAPSPEVTQSRLFAGSRFWRLDPGKYEVELWYRLRHTNGAPDEHLMQAEIEIGLTPHIQLDIYENLQMTGTQLDQEGNQIEMRYSFSDRYGAIFGNPTLYLEWHPRYYAPDRAEVRLLLGGEMFTKHLIGAANLYVEQNIDNRHGPEGVDGEFGGYLSASYGFLDDHLRLGAEAKIGADQHGGPDYVLAADLGPNIALQIHHFKVTSTFFFGLTDHDPKLEPYIIIGYGFP